MNAIAVIDSKLIKGTVKFHTCAEHRSTLVMFDLKGPKNSTHAIHIHEYGDTSGGCKTLGSHWNPKNTTHGSWEYSQDPRHAGDLINNLTFDDHGNFKFGYVDPSVKIKEIFGRSIVIHDGVDDLGQGGNAESLKTGNAGGRIACAVIGRASS